jgi:hypothetical protein
MVRVLPKPVDVFDRDAEWADLVEFAVSDLPGLRIAVVYGLAGLDQLYGSAP